MDQSTIHIVVSSILTLIIALISWLFKTANKRLDWLEKDFHEHKTLSSIELAKLNSRSDEVYRRLESIETKLDKLLENRSS